MKSCYLKFLLILAIASNIFSIGKCGEMTTSPKLTDLNFLIGSWRAALPPKPDGQKFGIETRFEFTGNHQGIRFDSFFVTGEKRSPYVSGMYFFDPEKKQLSIIYNDAQGAVTTGVVSTVGQAYQHLLRDVNANGKVDSIKTEMIHPDEKTFVNKIFMMDRGEWKNIVEVTYIKNYGNP